MLHATIALLLVAQDPTFSFEVKNRALGEVILALELPVQVDEELSRKPVTLKVDDSPLAAVLEGLAKSAGGKVVGKRIVTQWRYDIHTLLQKKRIMNAGMRDIELEKALEFIRAVSGANIVLDPGLSKTFNVEFNLADANCSQALDLLTTPNALRWDLRYGVVFVSSAERMKALPRLSPRLPKNRKTVSVYFDKATMPQVANYLTAATGAKFVVGEKAKPLEVDAVANKLTLAQALALCLYPIGCTAEAKEDSIVIRRR